MMALPSINLDDRDFNDLVAEAKMLVQKSCPQWSDLSPGDPGLMLLELFAHLTDIMIYRINRLPQKAFVEFLRLLGVQIQPPSAATTKLTFTLEKVISTDTEIPIHTRVAAAKASSSGDIPVFVTSQTGRFLAGAKSCTVEAFHGEVVDAELAGYGNGLPGLSVKAQRAPILSNIECTVGIEVLPDEITERVRSITYKNKVFRVWKEVENFANPQEDNHIYVIDRTSGTISFAPSIRLFNNSSTLSANQEALGEVVKEGREVRLWYARGGGKSGNIDKNTLTVLKDPVGRLSLIVTNNEIATGGSDAESFENALIRGPLQFRSLERAVTSSDFELIAKQTSRGAIVRAHAYTKASLWKHALRGTVEVGVVPVVPDTFWNNGRISRDTLISLQKPDTLSSITGELVRRSPLGIAVSVNWVKYKPVKISARVVVSRGEKTDLIRNRILERLYKIINPIPSDFNNKGWNFDTPIRASNVYDAILSEAGVKYADSVKFSTDSAPNVNVKCLQADAFEEGMWYSSSGSILFRSSNDGTGWEQIYDFGTQEEIRKIECHKKFPGYVAISTNSTNPAQKYSRIYLSKECGENPEWQMIHQTAFEVEDIAWTERENIPLILLAAETGLYQLTLTKDAIPVPVVVDPQNQALGFYAVTTGIDSKGVAFVAVSAKKNGGVYLSDRGGYNNTFVNAGLKGEDVRLLEIYNYGGRSWLWAAFTSAGTEIGKGCARAELRASTNPLDSWTLFSKQWAGGSCFSIAFRDDIVFAGSHNAGVLRLASANSDASWQKHTFDCGLPFRKGDSQFDQVFAVATSLAKNDLLLTGGPKGVFKSKDGQTFEVSSKTEYTEKVSLPSTWLFCSSEHEIVVVSEDEAN
ncbi:MAG: putative baseplate assembly protein [Fibrobacter sp.]|nr:putative baseplate assembly protein [Fibrobacter sp.]